MSQPGHMMPKHRISCVDWDLVKWSGCGWVSRKKWQLKLSRAQIHFQANFLRPDKEIFQIEIPSVQWWSPLLSTFLISTFHGFHPRTKQIDLIYWQEDPNFWRKRNRGYTITSGTSILPRHVKGVHRGHRLGSYPDPMRTSSEYTIVSECWIDVLSVLQTYGDPFEQIQAWSKH